MARILLLVAFALLTACATSTPRRASLTSAELLSGDAFSVAADARAPITRQEILALDRSMRDFVATEVGRPADTASALRKLLAAMKERGLFALGYTQDATRTPRATFHERQGNCLSFTMLFVALAREAGLDVRYQIVDVPPNWSSQGGVVLVNAHINARVQAPFGEPHVVDFNEMRLTDDYRSREVSDDHALALFYNNLGAEALIREDYATAFLYLRQSIATQPKLAEPWVGLGLLYTRRMLHEHAEAAYLQALERDSSNRSALTNLANLARVRGDYELEAAYRERVRRYQQRNPYYHFSLAQAAYAERSFDEALTALRRAVRLKNDEHQFYFLQGLVYVELGERPLATTSFARAREFATHGDIRAQYDAHLEALAAGR
jgi:Flp pilus assembly protein TadD